MAAPTHTNATTQAEAGHEGGGAFPPFQTDTFASQLIWLAIAFGALYGLMAKVALPRLEGAMRARSERIHRDLEEAHALRAQSEAAGAAYETALSEARDRAKAIAQETRDTLTAESDRRRKALEAELAEKLAASDAAIKARTAEAMGNVRGIAAEAATAIVERLTNRAPDRATVETALDRTLRT
ncbi:MAG: F0F1 ATP synthase subunit B' [Methylobacteriaceae bacterium]|nr:F0F1 ATP synthase subunit B' [Methylobacteriaceae bacterium]